MTQDAAAVPTDDALDAIETAANLADAAILQQDMDKLLFDTDKLDQLDSHIKIAFKVVLGDCFHL